MALLGSANPEVVVIGAGPYGLSIAAHLRQRRIAFRIFGVPMQNWRGAMPKGMFLKSDGAGSSFSDPARALTLAHHCAVAGLSYRDQGMPIPLDTFVDYGLAFQRTLVPEVEECSVVALAQKLGAFELRLDTGEQVTAQRVIVAVGTTYFGRMPGPLTSLPRELVSHCRDHADLARFAGRDVVVIGGGQSALETAALLNEQGASVRVLVRADSVAWNPPPCEPTGLAQWSQPRSALGRGWKMSFYCHGQSVFQYFPQKFRAKVVRRALGPAGAWWLKDRIVGKFPVLCRHNVQGAREAGGRVCLSVAAGDGQKTEIFADHIIAATGYKVDIGALPFLDAGLQQKLRREGTVPVLSPNFESSVPGLYFTGLVSANQFGPSMRFVVGADYTARRVASAMRVRASFAVAARRRQWLSSVPHD
jgi:cation diffusion facilitator CzcD-associated flavoprotein CzcO